MQIAEEDLQRDEDDQEIERHSDHHARVFDGDELRRNSQAPTPITTKPVVM